MAGGDYALIKSVEGFEDFAPFGRKQIADLGVSKGDMVFAITEGGETSFVIGTAWQGLEAGARVVFVYNNPDEVLRAHVKRSREVIDEPRIRKVNLTTGPMAITGSTRMQATSIELLAMLTVLEMTLREVLARAGAAEPGLGPSGGVPEAMRDGLRAVHAELMGERLRRDLARLVEAEEQVYREGRADLLLRRLPRGGRAHRHHRAQPDLLHAVVPQVGRRRRPPSRGRSSSRPRRRARRPGRACCGASRRRSSGRRRTCARSSTRRPRRSRARSWARSAGASCCASGSASTAWPTGRRAPATASRPWWRSGTFPSWRTGGAFARQLARAREAGAYGAVIAVGRRAALARLTATAAAQGSDGLTVGAPRCPRRPSSSTRSRASA